MFVNPIIVSHLNKKKATLKTAAGSAGMKSEGNNENKDTGYSSSSSSSTTIMGQLSTSCQNCNVLCNELKQTSFGNFCYSCYHHWRYRHYFF